MPELLAMASKAMEHLLTPVGPEGLGRALMPLMLTTVMPNTDGMSDETQQAYFGAKVQEYTRLLEHYPADIIRDACDAHVKRSKFFPAIAELTEFAEPALAHRHRQARRLEVLIKNGGRPPVVAEDFKPEPEVDRLRGAIKRYLANPNSSIAHVLKRRAIESEKRLAEMESRDVEAWALDVTPEAVAKVEEPSLKGTLPRDDAKWSKASDAAPSLRRSAEQQHAVDETRRAKVAMAEAGMP